MKKKLNYWNWEKFEEKIGENKIGCLVIWRHEQDTNLRYSFSNSQIFRITI